MSSQKPGCLAALFGIRAKPQSVFPYKAKPYFFSNAEASFYHLLLQMTGENIIVFPHVALRDLVTITGINKSDYYKYYNQIDRKQIDFLLVDAKNLKPMLVIELDDSSHQRPDRVQRDIFVEKVLTISRIPFVRIPVKQSHDPKELVDTFRKAIQKNQQNTG
jgi:very-short-patch-repair endonuclease